MEIDLATLSPKDVYGFMIQAIVPRPIAWVLSDNGTGNLNLAPFSYFNGVGSKPPTLSISIGRKRDGEPKDTWRNIEERSHFVVHIAGANMAQDVSKTAASLDFGDSEVEQNNIELTPVPDWPLPRITRSKIALLCEHYGTLEVGEGPQGLIIGKIKRAHVADDIIEDPLSVSATGLNPLARLGGDDYTSLGPVFTVERPA